MTTAAKVPGFSNFREHSWAGKDVDVMAVIDKRPKGPIEKRKRN